MASVAVGKEATVSQNNITVAGWTGVGYIITDPETGAGAYRISGGGNGGYLDYYQSISSKITNVLIIISLLIAFSTTPVSAVIVFIVTIITIFHAIMNTMLSDLKLIENGCPEGLSNLLWALTASLFILPKLMKNRLVNFAISLYSKLLGAIPAVSPVCSKI